MDPDPFFLNRENTSYDFIDHMDKFITFSYKCDIYMYIYLQQNKFIQFSIQKMFNLTSNKTFSFHNPTILILLENCQNNYNFKLKIKEVHDKGHIFALREEFRRTDKRDTQTWKVLTVLVLRDHSGSTLLNSKTRSL